MNDFYNYYYYFCIVDLLVKYHSLVENLLQERLEQGVQSMCNIFFHY